MTDLFRKYDHLERSKHPDVADICFGTVHVFPKIDGTNASVWTEPVEHPLGVVDLDICCGSRKRVLSADADNAGFHAWVHGDDPRAIALRAFVLQFPDLIVYGEWLVPHTLKTYREDAWRRFYVFDVWSRTLGGYLPYEVYSDGLAAMGIDVIPPLAIIENPSENQLAGLRDEANTYLIQDDCGVGEGIVLKNYAWANKYGRQTWSKVVRNEFKEDNAKVFGMKPTQGKKQTEWEIVTAFCTPEFIRKTFAKVVGLVADEANTVLCTEAVGVGAVPYDEFVEANRHKIIPRFLGTVYLEFIEEETRAFVKKYKNPVVDFGKLQKLVTLAAKRTMKDIF
jgi:hypothetical protein